MLSNKTSITESLSKDHDQETQKTFGVIVKSLSK